MSVRPVMRRNDLPLVSHNRTPGGRATTTSRKIRNLNCAAPWHGHCNNVFAYRVSDGTSMQHSASEAISFGPYRLLAKPRRLERAGLTVPLGDRAFDILCVLTERAGEIVTRSELMARVWAKVIVGEGSLRFHINALRRILAQDGTQTEYIRNVPRRGYVFTAPVRAATLPGRPADMVGRISELKDIIVLLNRTAEALAAIESSLQANVAREELEAIEYA
jgi:DNA-binding winged helix-turn-helix (wHTH) protein